MTLAKLWGAMRNPVHPETREHLRELWEGLAPELQTNEQLYGKQWEGCGATIGAMPRCDFGCTACYLGSDANSTPALPKEAVRAQLQLIRKQVGRQGNVQLTDGEIALRPVEDLLELLRCARELELIPMVMTHGDALRLRPGFLERLVAEGGLSEISLHVDTTQRGRHGVERTTCEADLHPIRAELAERVRDVRRRTGRELRVASTVTVTRSNLAGVSSIVRWMLDNNDVFRILSFQPVADVGRTLDGQGVSREELWDEISKGLSERREAPDSAWHSDLRFGHPSCTHVVMGAVWKARGQAARFVPMRDPCDARSEASLRTFFERFGGLSFRSDGRLEALARTVGLAAHAPGFWLGRGPRWAAHWLRRLEPGAGALRNLTRLARGSASLGPLALVSHHFMDRHTLESDAGQEREAACVFKVPVGGELVSMCRVNATGLRSQLYADLRQPPIPTS